MTLVRLIAALQAKPFRPFMLNLVDGRKMSVTHPESVDFYENERSFSLVRQSGTLHVIDSTHVVDIEYSSPARPAPTGRNL